MKFWQSSNECKRCGLVLKDDLSAEDRRDDLIRKSALVTNNNSAGILCASCRLIPSNSKFGSASVEGQSKVNASQGGVSDEHYISTGPIINWFISRGKNSLIWGFIAVFAFVKISGITDLFDDTDSTKDIMESPTKILIEDRAVPFNSPGEWVTPNDYPTRALREEREGVSHFKLTISEEGKVSDCNITKSSGHEDLDEATCKAVMKRAIFYKGLDAENLAIESKYNTRVRWQIPE